MMIADPWPRRKIALENVRNAFQSMTISLIELFIVEKIKKEMEGRFTLEGNEYHQQAFAQGKGIVLVISHLGVGSICHSFP